MKKLLSIFLALALSVGLCVPAFAEARGEQIDTHEQEKSWEDGALDGMRGDSEETEPQFQELDQYNEHTISFLNTSQSTETDDSINIVSTSNNVDAAQEFVWSLDLGSMGYQYIEDSCLAQLEFFSECQDFILTSYTVLVPKTRASTPTLLGTYNKIDFYSAIYSNYTVEFKKKSITSQSTLQQWANNTVNFALCFASSTTSVPFTIYQALMGVQKYTIQPKAYLEYYYNLSAHCRGIYVKKNNEYAMVVSDEYGLAYPFTIFHPVDTSLSGAYPKDYASQVVSTPVYFDTSRTLKDAYGWYAYGESQPLYIRLTDIQPTVTW